MSREQRVVDYIGDDQVLYELLVAKLDEFKFARRSADRLESDIAGSDWERVVVLDVNVAGASGFWTYECLRAENAGAPIVLLIDPTRRPTTQLGVGRMGNAHAMFLKPLTDVVALRDSLRRAFVRIDAWRTAFAVAGEHEGELAVAMPAN